MCETITSRISGIQLAYQVSGLVSPTTTAGNLSRSIYNMSVNIV